MACDDRTGCPTDDKDCKSAWDITESNECFIDNYVNEALEIAGAKVNVFKLLGVHEQQKLIDQVGFGEPLTSGSPNAFPPINAFTSNNLEWRSFGKGSEVVNSVFIGYDFGTLKLDNGRARYGIDAPIHQHITTIIIKQSVNSSNRVTKARIERSNDNIQWYGAGIVELPNDNNENQISFKRSVPSRYWRIRPLEFSGGAADSWNVERLQLIHYNDTQLDNFDEDYIFMETRNRDYAKDTILLKGQYDLIDVQAEISRWGMDVPSQELYIQIGFTSAVNALGRPVIIGDILELPSETQYDPNMNPVKKYLEVTDVGWSTEGYTPGWTPSMLRVVAKPALASQETQDVFGDFAPTIGTDGFLEINREKYQDVSNSAPHITAEAKTQVPERGSDIADIAEIPADTIVNNLNATGTDLNQLNLNPNGLYMEDALPPNGEPYTIGDLLPTIHNDGDYHRLTYSGLAEDVPPRLYRWSTVKNRWLYLETDRRFEYNKTKPTLQEYLKNGVPLGDIKK